MALTGSNKGAGGNTTGATSIGITPTSNCTAGALLLLAIGYDNAGTSGADPYSSISDTVGNTWAVGAYALSDPGAANAGVALRIFYSYQNIGAVTTGDTITVSFGTSVTNKRWTLTQIAAAAGYYAGPTITSTNNQDLEAGDGSLGVTTNGQIAAGFVTASAGYGYSNSPNTTSKCVYMVRAIEANITQWDNPPSSGVTWATYQTSTDTNMSIGSSYLINNSGSSEWRPNGTTTDSVDLCVGGAYLIETELPASSQDPFGQFGFFGI